MSTFHIRALDRDHPVAPDLLDLVQAASTGPPYHYDDSEIDPAHQWFPPLVWRSNLALVGVDQGGAPVGYCVTTPLVGSPGLADIERELVSVPVRAHYIAELGVAETVRRRDRGANTRREPRSDRPLRSPGIPHPPGPGAGPQTPPPTVPGQEPQQQRSPSVIVIVDLRDVLVMGVLVLMGLGPVLVLVLVLDVLVVMLGVLMLV